MLQHLTASRLIIIIGVIFLSQSLIGNNIVSKAQTNQSLKAQMYSELNSILDQQDKSSFANLTLSSLDLSSPEDLGTQDIYLRIHNSLNLQNQSDIYEAVSITTGYSTSIVEGVIESGVLFLPEAEIDSPDVISQTDIYNQIRQVYKQEKDFFTTISKLKQYTYIHEIFTDGDVSNSGFDLISDLNEIEEKLFFQKTIPTLSQNTINQNTNPWANLIGTSGLSIPTSSISITSPTDTASDSNTPAIVDNSSNPNSTSNQAGDTVLDEIPDYQFETIQFGQVCHIDEKIKEEVQIFEDQISSQETGSSTNSSNQSSQPSNPIDNGSNSASSSSDSSPTTQSTSPIFNTDFLSTTNNCPKDQIFCFTQEIKYNQIDLKYPETSSTNQDCVACVVERIGKSLQELLDGGVLPRKITGNFGEPPLCKKASVGQIGINLHLIPKPILPDVPNSDLIRSLDSELIETEAIQNNSISNDPQFSITQETRIDNSQNIIDQQQQNSIVSNFDQSLQLSSSEQSKIQVQVQNQQVLVDQLNNQISTLNSYFESLNKSLKDMDSSLQVLANKKECSQL